METIRKTEVEQELHLRGQVVQGTSNIAKLGKDWDELFARAQEAPAFLSRAWAQTFISEKRVKGTPLLIVVWCGSKLVALLPLTVRSFCGIRIAEPIGTAVPSYLGLLIDSNYVGATRVVADVWVREKVAHVFYNKYLSSLDEVTGKLIAELASRGFMYKCGHQRICPWVRLGYSFDEYLKRTKTPARRKKLHYEEGRLLKSGKASTVCYVGKDITPEVLEWAIDIQSKSWMKRRGAAVLGQPFYRKLLGDMAKAGLSRMWLTTIDGGNAAFVYAFTTHKKLNYAWTAFDLKYEPLSIGKVLTYRAIADACGEGILSFDFGMGDSEYKQFWATDNHSVERVVAGRGLWGYLIVLCYRAMWWLAKQKWLFSVYLRLKKWRNINKQGQHSIT
jgi:CelD/BcsL family acetyltransferase involved in cellulose biosynthesis